MKKKKFKQQQKTKQGKVPEGVYFTWQDTSGIGKCWFFFYFSEYLSKNIVTGEKSFTVLEHGTTNSILVQPQSSLSR